MTLAALEPGQEMAIANFTLAICFLFTFAVPLLLITRGDKTESNRKFIAATVNPWSQIAKEIELTPVAISEVNPTLEELAKPEFISDNNVIPILDSNEGITTELKVSEEQEKSSAKVIETNDEVLAA